MATTTEPEWSHSETPRGTGGARNRARPPANRSARVNAKRARTIAVVAPLGCAIVGNALTGNALTGWYPRLRKSRWVLPLWAFIPVAVAYYVMCGALLYRLLALVAPSPARGRTIALLLGMMGANEGWNYLFFGRKDLRASFAGMLGFVGLTVALYGALDRIDGRSATILRPYLGWLGYDVVWVGELWRLNRRPVEQSFISAFLRQRASSLGNVPAR